MVERSVSLLAARMRASGARVGVGDVLTGHRALAAVDAASRDDAYHALRAALCASRSDLAAFDRAWAQTFVSDRDPSILDDLMQAAQAVLPRAAAPSEARMPLSVADEAVPAAYSGEELLIGKDFARYTAAERAAPAPPAAAATSTTPAPPCALPCATAVSPPSGASASPFCASDRWYWSSTCPVR